MFGLKPVITGSKLMNEQQYNHAREDVVCPIQTELDRRNPVGFNAGNGSDSENSLDGIQVDDENDNRRLAEREMRRLEQYKMQKYLPRLKMTHSLGNKDSKGRWIEIGVGPVEKRGENLPSGNNISDYLDAKGRMDLLAFFKDHQQQFPNLFIVIQREIARRVTEAGCERFFGQSGYVSQPRRSQLGVRNYERLALLGHILQHVYVDPKFVAEEYLARCKRGAWKKENTLESLKCYNLERILEAKEMGKEEPSKVDLDVYVGDVVGDIDDED